MKVFQQLCNKAFGSWSASYYDPSYTSVIHRLREARSKTGQEKLFHQKGAKEIYDFVFEKKSQSIPEKHKKDLFSIDAPYDFQAVMVTWFQDPNKWLYLFGKNNTGKTTLAYSLAFTLMKGMIDVEIVSASSLEIKLKSSISGQSLDEYFDLLCKKKILIIDDLGSERASAFNIKWIGHIVSYRHDHDLTTIFFSSFSLSELYKNYVMTSNTQQEVVISVFSKITNNCILTNLDEDN